MQEIRNLGCGHHKDLNTAHDNSFPQRVTTQILKPRHHYSHQAAGDRKVVDDMETLQKYKNSRKQEITGIPRRSIVAERSWSATSRTSSIKCAWTNKDTRNPTWNKLKEQQMKRGITYRTGILQRPMQGGTILPRRRQRHLKDRRTP